MTLANRARDEIFNRGHVHPPGYRMSGAPDVALLPTACSALLDDEALHGAAEGAAFVGKPRHRKARAVGADRGAAVEQDPFSHRLPRHAHGEIGVDEGPLPEIERGRRAVAE